MSGGRGIIQIGGVGFFLEEDGPAAVSLLVSMVGEIDIFPCGGWIDLGDSLALETPKELGNVCVSRREQCLLPLEIWSLGRLIFADIFPVVIVAFKLVFTFGP